MSGRWWLRADAVVDVVAGRPVPGADAVEIRDGRIARIGAVPAHPDGPVRELPGHVLTPGLVSCHAHLSVVYPFTAIDPAEPSALTALRAAARAEQALNAGVTTLRCVHEQHGVDLVLRRAAAAGWVRAPRIVGAGRALSVTGGHGAGFGSLEVDGPEAFLAAARHELRAGADHLKVFLTGGIAAPGENLDEPQMTDDELTAVLAAAAAHNAPVVAHAASAGPIRRGLAAGIRSFEHGYRIDPDTARLMAEAGAVLGPTLCVTRLPEWMRANGFTEWQVERALAAGPAHLESVRTAVAAGVRVVNSTDYPPGAPVGDSTVVATELGFLVEAGLTPAEALRASTVGGAELLRVVDKCGSLDPGKAADVLAVDGDPLEDPAAMGRVAAVVQAGVPVRGCA